MPTIRTDSVLLAKYNETLFFIEEPNVLHVCIKDENGNNNGEVFFFRYNIFSVNFFTVEIWK